ncbi:MAG: 2-oxoglutarate dehydrogenase complex dihydrolipoyllysine-residue succinyltransferase [Betaproteobacteria bacterium]|nr:MAG: 2-oxoglutarate dehydrogenase complex dihydrolipoyllysine-residue succinyltransferase [Betaproteobacteria bacterium]TDI82713.1 MAG: 2-oxoglutarate dehydrogenase complex dihydrolipoyllysine-residue succinyltransferase [Betaproteobacteria bacterium]
MLVEVKVPVLSETIAEATLVSWHKKQGEFVERDENLIDIETDKVVMELPASVAGILAIIKGDGTTVVSSELIATIDTEVTAVTAPARKIVSSGKKSIAAVKPAMLPAARRMAAKKNIKTEEISAISGTGRGGRITKEDVVVHVESKFTPGATTASAAIFAGNRPEQRVAMSRLRLRIAERMVQSQSTAAILTTFNEVNMQAIIDFRARYRDKFEKEHGVKLGFTSFFIKAVVAALKKFPIVNASVDGNDIIYHGYYDIGIAVGSPRGLVVPIIRDADRLSQAEVERQVADFSKRAREGKLTIEELTGGTFSITNGGVFGSMLSTPIINPPQSAILGVHAIKERPVAENGQVVIRPINYLALSYDHRIIDGREAVLSLVAMKEALEYPMSPLLEA